MEFNKYSSIENLYKNGDILLGEVVVTEKLHGTNCRFGWIDDTFYIGSRNNTILTWKEDGTEIYNKENDGYNFCDWLRGAVSFVDLPRDTLFYGEFFGSGVQKGMKYFDVIKRHFAVFDVKQGEDYLDYDDAVKIVTDNKLDFVPLVFRGKLNLDGAKELIDVSSTWALAHNTDCIAEGVVIKPIKETRDFRDNRVIVKLKGEKWSEVAKAPKMPKERSKFYEDGKAYCTKARVINTIDKLRQEVNEELEMLHVPNLLRLFNTDVEKGAVDDLPLSKKDRKEFMKGASSDVVKYYKEWLLES